MTINANSTKWTFIFSMLIMLSSGTAPSNIGKLEVVTYSQFNEFVEKTGYISDAEQFGWSIVQKDVYSYYKVVGANWRKPDGQNCPLSVELPVTQVSYNDAIAYCEWSGSRLPTYDEYWRLIKEDKRKVITNNNGNITVVSKANILGNVWEITNTIRGSDVRLAGGSLFCSPSSCHGTTKDKILYVDKQTGNIHIGFAVLH